MNALQEDDPLLIRAAESAHKNAYAPYSKFKVGAALLTETGEIFTGCNVENSSYGLTVCAERHAVAAAVAQGHHRFKAIAIYTPTEKTPLPCGACCQVLAEFNPEVTIVLVKRDQQARHLKLSDLFTQPFQLHEHKDE